MAKKKKKSKDLTRCCLKCKFFFKGKDGEEGTCSLTAENISEDNVCSKFNTEVSIPCIRCGKEVKYKDKESYYNSVYTFSMDSKSGSSSFQKFHLCRKCASIAHEHFYDFLNKLRKHDNLT